MTGPAFIDIAVLEPMRSRFAAGDALILLEPGLDTVIWANGSGAALLGHDTVEAAIGAQTDFSAAARRQIMATPGFPAIGENRTVIVRIGRAESRAVLFRASGVELSGTQRAILLAAPLSEPGDAARQIVTGLCGPGEEAAWLDADGAVLAETPGFDAVRPDASGVSTLVAEATRESDRLVKRIVDGKAGRVGVGLARLADSPPRFLLILVTEGETESAPADAAEEVVAAEDVAAPKVAANDTAGNGSNVDGWYFSDPGPAARPDPNAAPVRFAWRTDADGRFSAVSPEFAQAVGGPAADVIGRTFAEVARVFAMDPTGEVSALLDRRDTWSGRTVLWPVSGTDLKVPVDLAALPAYLRDRTFDGFRGFGIVRLADAVVDPEGFGISLVPGTPPEDPGAADPFQGEAPVIAAAPAAEPAQDTEPLPDKVVRLHARKSAQGDSELSQTERQAFREIGERLKADGGEAPAEAASGEPSEEAPPVMAEAETSEYPHDDAVPMGTDATEPAGIETTPADEDRPEAAIEAPEPAVEALEPPVESSVAAAPAVAASPALLSRLPLPMLVHSGDRLHYANAEFLERTGYASLADLADAGGLGALIAGPYPANDDDPARRRAVKIVTRSGEEEVVEAHLQTIPWSDGRALLLSLRPVAPPAAPVEAAPSPAVAQAIVPAPPPVAPITDSEPPGQADPALQARVAELETILDTATDGILTLDGDGTIRSVSRAAEALFGFDAADLTGKAFTSLFATESQRAARDYLSGLTENGVASVLNDGREVIGREAKGGFIPLFMTIGRLPGDSGFCAVLRDITQFKRTEEELTQARRKAETASSQKSDFLARVSHEIRTPLNAIIGFSELMLDEKFGPVGSERYRDYLRDINKSGNHVLDLVNDLLDISKIEAGQQDLSYEAVRLNETLADAVSLMQPQANRGRVIIRSSLAANLPEVVADLRSVKQIALNLLSNAVRYTNPGGQVIVSTSYEANGDVILRVRDTGIGMTRGEIEQALKPFKQVTTLKRARGDGTGLGLPLTKALVEANRARFVIDSTPGQGTLAEVVFPSTRVLAQ